MSLHLHHRHHYEIIMSPSQLTTADDSQQNASPDPAEPVTITNSTAAFKHSKNLPTPQKIFLLYASQTGQAESISEFIHSQFTASSGVLKPIEERLSSAASDSETKTADAVLRSCAEKYESDLLEQFLLPPNRETLPTGAYLAIIVASTTGQGDPPDTANKFFRWIRRLKRAQKPGDKKPLAHLSYALLGLGDTNYDNFANFGHLLDRHLTDLGAVQYVTAGLF